MHGVLSPRCARAQVDKADIHVSKLFKAMESRPHDLGIDDWGLRQSSLEEVFLRIARESGDPRVHA